MLKKIRVVLAVFFISAATLLFLDYTGKAHNYLGWVAKVQFVPALFALNIIAFASLLLLTAFLGRVYCSAVCPLGICQDIVSRIAGLFKKNRFAYRPPKKALVIVRYSLLGIFVLTLMSGLVFIPAILEPYSAYGRMVSQIAGPLYKYGNNILAGYAERAGSYAFYSVDIWMKGIGTLVVSILTLVVVGVFAWKSGRGYCNSVCPVGALLGYISKFAMLKPRIDEGKCSKCQMCAKNCKAGCIDAKQGAIDYTRCVTCFNCVSRCPKKAITYVKGYAKGAGTQAESSNAKLTEGGFARRALFSSTALLGLGFASRAFAKGYDFDGGLTPLKDKKASPRKTPIVPPGSSSAMNLHMHCTGCQLCVSVCPNNVLRPSSKIKSFMQPESSFERGYCRPECVKCSEVCPTGAICQITVAEKSATQVGCAVWKPDLCVVNKDKVACDLCSRKCPAAAIFMIPQNADDAASLKIPIIDIGRCIGCGACEHLCPSRPHSAIYVEGIEVHRTV